MRYIVPVSGQFVVRAGSVEDARIALTRFLASEGLANIRVQAYGIEVAHEVEVGEVEPTDATASAAGLWSG